MHHYDAIVIGTGGVGSAAVMQLAVRGARVLGLDRFAGGHDRGSSHGQTRVIRRAYFEHSDYVPLVQRAFELWDELERASEQRLFQQTGLLQVGPADGLVLPGVLRSARQHQLDVESFTADEVGRRFPGFVAAPDCAAVLETGAGFLYVERCVLAHLAEARRHGAELRSDVTVRSWRTSGDGVVVETDQGAFAAGRLVIAAGAWAAELLADLGVPLRVLRKPLHWFANDDPRYGLAQGCPVFLYECPGGVFYGFPDLDDGRGLKAADHHGGAVVDDPLAVSREVDTAEHDNVARFLAQHLPGVSHRAIGHAVCMYTMSPDEHFIVDRHPGCPQVAFAAGLSGHGFKFTSVLGEALADLALEGATTLPIGFLSVGRFGVS
ncbi:MAG: N-methyl-L-tryptophan oxidase [Pirellulales bacterium]